MDLNCVSWDPIGPTLGEGEYAWRLYGPTEHTAWTPIETGLTTASSPELLGREVVSAHQGALDKLDRWKINIYANGDPDTNPAFVGTYVAPHLNPRVYP